MLLPTNSANALPVLSLAACQARGGDDATAAVDSRTSAAASLEDAKPAAAADSTVLVRMSDLGLGGPAPPTGRAARRSQAGRGPPAGGAG
jgi:hypothetical protein